MTAATVSLSTYSLDSNPADVLADLARAGNYEARNGALLLYAGQALHAAADKAGAEAAEFELHTEQAAFMDYAGLKTDCERTAKWLARWLEKNLGRGYVRKVKNGYLAVYAAYSCGD